MRLWSESFLDGAMIPSDFAFAKIDPRTRITLAGNRNPHLAWDDVPDATRSFALICRDLDAPGSADDVNRESRSVPADLPRVEFFHWTLINLPAAMREIEDGEFSDGVVTRGKSGPVVPHSAIDGAMHGLNDYTGWFADDHDMAGDYYGYDGPCPPWNDTIVHRYVFTLYALSVERLAVDGKWAGSDVRAALANDVLAAASIMGRYTLNPTLVAGSSTSSTGKGAR